MGRQTETESTGTRTNETIEDVPDERDEILRNALLRHHQRQAIVDLLAEKPGLNREQIRRTLDMGLATAAHHVNKLVGGGLVLKLDSAVDGEHLYFLPEDKHLWENPRTRILFGRRESRDVALFIADHPGATSDMIADAIGKSVYVARWHLKALLTHNLVVRARTGRVVEYFALTDLREWAQEFGPRFEDVT